MKKSFLVVVSIFFVLLCFSSSSFAYSFGTELFSGEYTYGYDSDQKTYDHETAGNYLGTVYKSDGGGTFDYIDTESKVDNLNDLDLFIEFLKFVKETESISIDDKERKIDFTESGIVFTDLFLGDVEEREEGEEGEYYSGEWKTYSDSETIDDADVVDFIIVKGSNSYSVHEYSPGASFGEWNVGYLEKNKENGGVPGVSHISAFIETTTPVPEPATMLLLGSGLLGLVGLRRKKK